MQRCCPAAGRTRMSRRSYGTGSLFVRTDARGRETWYGQWRVGARLIKRRIGPKREAASRDGLNKAQGERELRRLIDTHKASEVVRWLSVGEAGALYIDHLRRVGRKRSTLMDYESILRIHLSPFFGERTLGRIEPRDIEAFLAAESQTGRAPKSVRNYLGLLHSILTHAQKRGWCTDNPCKRVDGPRAEERDADIRFLDQDEVEALLAAVPDDTLGRVERVLYLTAVITGLRQGELVALRWRDIDWGAGRLRVRLNYVRGEFGTPKSHRSSRSVPLAGRLAEELRRHQGTSHYTADEDLVFGHPQLGSPLDRSKLLKRFKAA